MGLPCELPPALHPGRGWGLRGLVHAKSLLDPPAPRPRLLPGAVGAAPLLSLGEGAAGGPRGWDPASGGTSTPGQGATSAARALAGFALTASPLRAHLRKGNSLAVTH